MIEKPKIICVSGKARHGKDTFAKLFKDLIETTSKQTKGVLHIGYADYLKYVCEKYFGWDGKKDNEGRNILQNVGTEVARTRHENIWVNVVIELVKGIGHLYDFVVISDVRFPNEVSRWGEEGYDVISVLVERIGFENELTADQKNHISETAMNDFTFDWYISNTDLDELRGNVEIFAKDVWF